MIPRMTPATRRSNDEDARTVAGFVVGWWPGLEDGLSWPSDADHPEANEVFAAARRVLDAGKSTESTLRAPEVADEEKRRAVEVFWRTVKADATLPSAVGVEAALEDFIAQRKGATEEAAESAELDQADCEGARTVNRTVTTGREDAKS